MAPGLVIGRAPQLWTPIGEWLVFGGSSWVLRDVVMAVVVLAGYVWLVALTKRTRSLSRRLGRHVCQIGHPQLCRRVDSEFDDAEDEGQQGQPITVAELLAREEPARQWPQQSAPEPTGSEQTLRITRQRWEP